MRGIVKYIIFIVLIEALLYCYSVYGVITPHTYPINSDSSFVSDIDSNFGVWHYSNYKYNHRQSCFDVVYQTNSYGARDIERSKYSGGKRRFVVLGDSFADGYGVNDSERVTNILEKNSGFEYLNFACAGSFGTIQEMLLYQSLAIKYEHTDVMIFFSPDTDFSDNRIGSRPNDRYVPYLKSEGDTFKLYYTVRFAERNNNYFKLVLSNTESYINYASNHLQLVNFVRNSLRSLYFDNMGDNYNVRSYNYISYNRPFYNDEDIKRLYYCLDKIREISEIKNIYLIIIPTRKVFEYNSKNGYDFDFVKDLDVFKNIKGVEVVDLLFLYNSYLKEKKAKYEDLFLSCDEHWNKYGNKVVAELLYKYLFDNKANDSQ